MALISRDEDQALRGLAARDSVGFWRDRSDGGQCRGPKSHHLITTDSRTTLPGKAPRGSRLDGLDATARRRLGDKFPREAGSQATVGDCGRQNSGLQIRGCCCVPRGWSGPTTTHHEVETAFSKGLVTIRGHRCSRQTDSCELMRSKFPGQKIAVETTKNDKSQNWPIGRDFLGLSSIRLRVVEATRTVPSEGEVTGKPRSGAGPSRCSQWGATVLPFAVRPCECSIRMASSRASRPWHSIPILNKAMARYLVRQSAVRECQRVYCVVAGHAMRQRNARSFKVLTLANLSVEPRRGIQSTNTNSLVSSSACANCCHVAAIG